MCLIVPSQNLEFKISLLQGELKIFFSEITHYTILILWFYSEL